MSVACLQEDDNLGFSEAPVWENVGGVRLGDAEEPKCQEMDVIWLPALLALLGEVTMVQFQDLNP